ITGYTEGMYDKLNEAHDGSAPQNSYRPTYEGFDSITADFDYAELEYRNDVAALKAHSCTKFAYTKEGFSAQFYNTGEDNLLLFSVPYDEGWSASVNGEPVEITKASIGFMAVRVPGHTESEIEFRYETPMLKTGCILSGAALLLLSIYITCNKGLHARRSHRKRYRIKQKSNT
ncbi:MAG: YfhO family protein, partial [Ruminococcus sp.]|nr:YfhO family protein [Ruminococcus sp.]